MAIYSWKQFKLSVLSANEWFRETPERALDMAYDAALNIKAIEEQHFEGQNISLTSASYGDSVKSYFNSALKRYLKVIETRLAEFNASISVVGIFEKNQFGDSEDKLNKYYRQEFQDRPSIILEKLEFIDEVASRYRKQTKSPIQKSNSIVEVPDTSSSLAIISSQNNINSSTNNISSNSAINTTETLKRDQPETSFLPRSLLSTFKRIKKELDPEAEEDVIKKFRKSKVKTITSVRFILLLILVPLLIHQLSKITFVGYLVDNFMPISSQQEEIFINRDLEEEALMELRKYEEELHFQIYLGHTPELFPELYEAGKEVSEIPKLQREELIEHKVEEKAQEIASEYKNRSNNAIKNIFCDLISLISFVGIISANRRDVEILKSFMDDVIYGLSDSAKAFILILLTDMFVGFHSPHGWEVILENVARHFGVAESRDFNFLFIATFPVILDAVFKYWIFRYLNRSSPSAVATYKNMNE
ncbi:MAG: proton extrusion protein PcxA [Okeania sp. SIO2G4]|uniref:proton extrusion protein PcxA n=1 Tax=unclassified Okeania TaxID=2634635 RepID=UPI0013B7B374|nr:MULTISPECIES: proton extrusion protein PcxA [unclassified Okeania]NEP04069.1 proton extrusion protein PcxA [Okeania sp. SIO4D6]NEP41356.1 proton extrusion protein PcxA [Okeania sp. SIO2H7]NEP74494.1 proton extrusion protein PcxA [Okeania sp. SIO2G5]NEP96612.1 proton extrusion protein PcxA [Okeania sp. SIO2F5]NEQ93309.1 proton extrusion protein PcxA [Okeania sp. SIO2G4]